MTPSPVNRMMGEFSGDFREGFDINLGVGYVNEDTLPRREVEEATLAVLRNTERYRSVLNYGASAGTQNLHDSIRSFLLRQGRPGLTRAVLDRCQMVVGASGVTSLLESIAAVLKPGLVITSDPLYYIYCDYLERLGYTILPIPEDEDGLRLDILEKQLELQASSIAFLYILGVGNPSSAILSNERRERLVDRVARAAQRAGRPIPLFLDGAYEFLIHDPHTPVPASVLGSAYDWIFELGTLSKLLAPALRIGYLLGRPSPFLNALVQRTSDLGFSASPFNQEIASHLLDHMADQQMRRVHASYRQKAALVERCLKSQLGPHLANVMGGKAGFYFYLTLDGIDTREGQAFHRYCSRTTGDLRLDGPPGQRNPKLLYIPGQFCVHPQGELAERGHRQLRISYGYESLPQLEQGMRILAEAVAYSQACSAA